MTEKEFNWNTRSLSKKAISNPFKNKDDIETDYDVYVIAEKKDERTERDEIIITDDLDNNSINFICN